MVQAAPGPGWLFTNPFALAEGECGPLFGNDLARFERAGVLTQLSVAADVPAALRTHARAIWAWLQAGATLYVCGEADPLARCIEAALLDMAQLVGALSAEQSSMWLSQLGNQQRYLKDVY